MALGCGSELDRLPGAHVGTLDSNNQLSRMANLRPGSESDLVADVTHHAGGETRSGARLTIRRVGESAGNPVFEADLDGLCTLRFEGYEGGRLGDGLQAPSCVCVADGRPIEGARSSSEASTRDVSS
ncbi:MAG: hypothetical protein H6711_02200 [Myxococcales bacterium]|nr:hypothetical protein [Myxococcales bacterium]